MKKFTVITLLFLAGNAPCLAADDVTISSYYPTPYGNYSTLTSTGQTVLATDSASTTANVGIGTATPLVKLDIMGLGPRGTLKSRGAGYSIGKNYLIPSGFTANDDRSGLSNDLYWKGDGSGNWRINGNGTTINGASAYLTSIVNAELVFYSVPSTAPFTDRDITNTELYNYEVMRVASDGNVGIGISRNERSEE